MIIPDNHRETVLDSLADSIENFDNAAQASEDDAAIETYSVEADLFAGVETRVIKREDLDTIDLDVVRDALHRSLDVCAEVDADGSDYQDALNALRTA